MGTVVSLYKSLITFVEKCGNNFMEYENKGKELSGKTEYSKTNARKKKKTVPFGEKRKEKPVLTARAIFKKNCFSLVISKLKVELKKKTCSI